MMTKKTIVEDKEILLKHMREMAKKFGTYRHSLLKLKFDDIYFVDHGDGLYSASPKSNKSQANTMFFAIQDLPKEKNTFKSLW